MLPSLNSVTSVKYQDNAYSDMDRRDDEGSEDLSNAELYLKRSKKRGLYVETETTETTTGASVTKHLNRLLPSKPQPQRFLPRDHSPLPGRSDSKPFVWSVLDDSSPITSESDIHEANKQIRNTIQEIKEAIKDINLGNKTKTKVDAAKKKNYNTAKTIEDDSSMEYNNIDVSSKDTNKSKSDRGRGCANAKDILEIRKKELTLTMRTVVKEPPNNRFSYRFVHEDDNSTTDSNQVKIRKRSASNETNKYEAKRRTSSKKIPAPIQINYNDEIQKTHQPKSKYVNDLNSNRESTFHFLGSDTGSKKEHDRVRHIGSYINEQQSSSKNLVVIQPRKEFNITSQSQISDSEELEVLDIDLNATSNDSMSCTKTLMGNNFYTNDNDRSKVLRKQDTNTNTYSSDDNEVFGIYSNYNDEETVKSVGSLEMPFIYDSVDDINKKEHGYDLARYLLDEKSASNADYSADERNRSDDYPKRGLMQHKRVHIAPKTIPPATTNYPRRNKKQRRTIRSFANAEKRRRYIEKEKLLNLIKQQLSMDYINMEPPRSVFEELKEMARNKRRRHKRVSFSNEIEQYERRLRKIPEKKSQSNQRHVKRYKKNPQSIIRQNTEIYKDIEFFNKVAALNKRVGSQKTKIMSPGYVNRRINEIHEEFSDVDEENELEVDEDASLEVITM